MYPPASADAERRHALAVDSRELHDDVGGAEDVLHAVLGPVGAPRLASALALVGRVESERDITVLGQLLGVVARHLVLHAAVGMRHHYCRIAPVRIVASRGVDVGHREEVAVGVLDGVDVNLALDVLGNGAAVDESEGVARHGNELALRECPV